MKKKLMISLFVLIFIIAFSACNNNAPEDSEAIQANNNIQTNNSIQTNSEEQYIFLPEPVTDGDMSVEKALATRRSHRDFLDEPISLEQLSQILWAAYGITLPDLQNPNLRGGFRTTPSAGALFPLEIHVIAGNVEGLAAGVYRYISEHHKLMRTITGDLRRELSEAALNQRMVMEAPATVFYSAVFGRTTNRYGERGIRYVYMELGHSAQNVYLQAEALGLGTCAVGAFVDSKVKDILDLPPGEEPLYLMPIGHRR